MKGAGDNRFRGRLGASFLLFVVAVIVSAPLLLAPKPAQAFPTEDIVTETQTTVVNVWNTLKDNLVEGAVSALVNGANYFLSKLAYEAAVALTSDCPGQVVCWDSKGFSEGLTDAWQGAVGEMVGTLSEEGGFSELGLNLCSPPSPDVSMNIQLGILNEVEPPEPSCDFNAIAENWTNWSDQLTSEETLEAMMPAFEPGQGSLSVALEVLGHSYDASTEAAETAALKRLAESGTGGFSDIIDPVSGRVLSPGSVVQKGFEKMETEKDEAPREAQQQMSAGQIAKGAVLSVVINTVQTFVQTFVSRLFNKFTSGILTAEEAITAQPDIILSEEGLFRPPGRSTARKALTRLLVSPPKDIGVIDPLLNFGVCPPSGRRPDNCVADAQLINAVRVAGATPFTVRDALEQGYLHGDWPLVSSSDTGRDQDPFCYTFAYCESNLKKLRAARVIPIGWEIAAHDAPVGSASWRLKDVVAGFNDCNDDGERDDDHPFCRLIDPDWVLKAPAAQCRAQSYGPHLVSPEIPQRQEQCVDTRTCLREDDMGNCVGGWGYCVREKNVWRFNGDSCPEYYNSCRTLNPVKGGSPVNYLMNTIDYGTCNSDNVGCRQYATTLNVVSCEMSAACVPEEGCERSCSIAEGSDSCSTADTTCRSSSVCENPDDCEGGCKILQGQRSCSSLTGLESDKSDDWLALPSRFFSDNVETCNAKDNGCSALVSLGTGQSLNFVENGGFERVDSGVPFGWLAPTAASLPDNNGYIVNDSDLAVEGSRSATLAGSATGRLVYGPLPAGPGKMHTVSAALKQDPDSTAVSLTVIVTLYDEAGVQQDPRPFSTTAAFSEYLAAYDTTDAGSNPCNYNAVLNAIRCTITYDDEAFDELRAGFSFLTTSSDVAQAAVEFYGAGAYLDAVQFEEGPLTPYHTGYNAGQRVNVKIAPDYLGCTGEESDRQECDSFAQMCRETEVGCDRYSPTSGDPAVPGIVGPQDYCPAQCNGYDTFFQDETDFEAAAADPDYFIPSTAAQCSSLDAGCTAFTNVETEAVENYSHLRLCLHEDDTNVETFYTWEGSDTTGYQLRAWSLQRTEAVVTVSANDICESPLCVVGSTVGFAPCVRLAAGDPDSCIDNPVAPAEREGFCTAADIEAGDYDCREFYDSSGNRHYRRLSKTIIASPDCRFYRLSGRTEADCEKGNGSFDATLGECIYRASPSWSDACPATAAGCRAYRGNAAMNVQALFVDDFEDEMNWVEGSAGSATDAEISLESLVVGGHSMRIDGATSVYREVGRDIADDSLYSLSFWARGSGTLTAMLGPGTARTCPSSGSSPCALAGGCSCTTDDGLRCTIPDGADSCTVPAGDVDDPDNTAAPGAWFSDSSVATDAPEVTLSTEWKEYTLGPVRAELVSGGAYGSSSITLRIQGQTEIIIDNIILKRVRDNIYVVRDSWKTPDSCDRTLDGVFSPQEMLGCREYKNTANSLVYLRSISALCRDKAVGCKAYSNTQNTADTTGYRTYGAVCRLAAECSTAPNCPCDFEPPDIAGITPATVTDACRVAIGESECRFIYEGIDAVGAASDYPDRFTSLADERLYLVAADDMQCPATSVGCRTMGVPEIQFERRCDMPDGADADTDPDTCDPAVVGGTCVCTDDLTGRSCDVPEGETKCIVSLDEGVIGAWRAIAFRDDPANYEKTLCETGAVGCEAFSGSDGVYYFKDPSNQVCEFKTNVKFEGATVSGWFRKSQSGAVFPCYDEYLIGGETYGILKNGDSAYGGWVGMCQAEFDRCEEFVDPLDTSETNPDGRPYYYLDNKKLDKSGCEGEVSLKQGCVLVQQTSNTQNYFSSAASYFRSDYEAGGDLVTPLDCNPNDPRRSSFCGERCYRKVNGTCSDNGLSCTQDSDCAGDCLGDDVWGTGCTENAECDLAAGEICANPETMPGIDEDEVTSNDANLVLKVRRDRECAEWLECESVVPTYDSNQGRWINRCANFGLCTQNMQVGESYVCSEFKQEARELLTVEDYVARDTTWRGLDYSGYSLVGRYPAQYLQSFQISTAGVCVGGSNAGAECADDAECDSNYCSQAEFDTTKFGIRLSLCRGGVREGEYCDDNGDCPGSSCVADCDADDDCPSDGHDDPGVTGDEHGSCLRGVCVYDFRGGPLKTDSILSGPSCRAYPEKDAPFPDEVLNTDGGETATGYDANGFGNPLQKKTAFRGANVCQEGNNCECSYRRVGYGTGQSTVRFHSIDSSFRHGVGVDDYDDGYAIGVCVGGNNAGTPCNPSAPGVTCGAPDQGGSCSAVGSVTNALGWPGFCVDTDESLRLYGDPDIPGCNLWLPVDIIPGMTDMFGQAPEAGFGAEFESLTMCTYAKGVQRETGVCSADMGRTCTVGGDLPEGCENCLSYAFKIKGDEAPCEYSNPVGTCMEDRGYLFQYYDPWPPYTYSRLYDFSPGGLEGLYQNDVAAVRIKLDGRPSMLLTPGEDYTFALHWNSEDFGLRMSDVTQFTYPSGSSNSYFVNEYDPGGSSCARLLDSSDVDGDCQDNSTFRQDNDNCLAIRANFDPASGAFLGLRSVLCATERDYFLDHVPVDWAVVYLRENCSAVSDVHMNVGALANVASTDKLYDLSRMNVVTSLPGLEDYYSYPTYHSRLLEAELDHEPLGVTAPAIDVSSDSLGYPISVIGSETEGAGSQFGIVNVYYSDSVIENTDFDPEFGQGVAAGLPWACVGPCRLPDGISGVSDVGAGALDTGIDRLSELFAVIFQTYEWDTAGGSYDERGDLLDRRVENLAGSASPHIRPVNLANCAGRGDVCEEMAADGIAVNGSTQNRCYAGGSAVNVQLQYYAFADSDHMPIRRKIVDFGDGSQPVNQSGSYKNHRGLESDGTEICNPEGNTDFGLSTDACDGRYYREQKTYTCSQAFAETLSECTPGNPFYPCKDVNGCCVFKPRVQVLDNWGVCNGSCSGDPGGSMCFNSSEPPGYLEAATAADDAADECYDLGMGGTQPNDRRYGGDAQPWTVGPDITVCPGTCPGT